MHFIAHRKKRPEARMNTLTQAQRDEAFAACEALPVREGVVWLRQQFNLRIGRSALSTWLREQRTEKSMALEVARLRENQNRATIIGNVAGSATSITVANSVLFSQAVFEEFKKPEQERNQDLMVHYMELALTAREQEIRASAIHLGFSRFHFDSGKCALKKAAALHRINSSVDDERSKIERAVTLLFGKPPEMPEIALQPPIEIPQTSNNHP
jgi:hypothetical protein